MYIDFSTLDKVAVDKKVLSSNIGEMPDCSNVDLNPKTEIVNRFPLVTWLLNTAMTARIRADRDTCRVHKDCDTNKWVIETPRELWSELPTSTAEECCWVPFDFAKCGGKAPLNLLCLKDCEDILDELVSRDISFGQSIPGLASSNERLSEVKRRIARMSMAFFTAYTAILGMDNVYTDILKPFHGLLQVMENPAIAVINGTNILSAFDAVACRLALLGTGRVVFAMNPVIYQGLLNVIRIGRDNYIPVQA